MTYTEIACGNRAFLPLALLFMVPLLLSGCGYTNPHSRSNELDTDRDGKVAIYIDMWQNRSGEFGYESTLQQSLVDWLKKSRRLILTRDRQQADYILTGTIHSARFPGLSYGDFDRAVEVRAELEFSYVLKNADTGEIVLRQQKFTRREPFLVRNSAVGTDVQKRKALQVIADDIADNVYIQLFYTFSRDDLKEGREEFIPEENPEE